MAKDMRCGIEPIDLRSKKSESEKTEHKCLGGNEKCSGCVPIIPTGSLVKTIAIKKVRN